GNKFNGYISHSQRGLLTSSGSDQAGRLTFSSALEARAEPMAAMKKIGILTGGGDVPGLNSVIKSVVYRASELGRPVMGIRKGWEGLTHVNAANSPENYILLLTRENTHSIDRTGGTMLHTSRTN